MSEKVGIFGGIKYSFKGLFKPKFFNRLSNQPKIAGIGFTILITIFTTAVYWGLMYLIMISGNGAAENVRKQMLTAPDFTYSNGSVTCDEFYLYNNPDETKYFILDSAIDKASDYDWQEYIIKTDWKNGKTILVFNGKTIAIKTGFGATFSGKYNNIVKLLGINDGASKSTIIGNLNMIALRCCIAGAIVTLPLFVLMSIAVSYIFGGLGFAFNKIVKGTYSFNDCVMIAMYIAPFPMFIARLLSVAPINISVWIIGIVVSLVFMAYMYFALSGSQEDVGPSNSVVFNKPEKTSLREESFEDTVRNSRKRGSAFAPSASDSEKTTVRAEEKQLDRAQETVRKYLSENPVPGVNFVDGNFASEATATQSESFTQQPETSEMSEQNLAEDTYAETSYEETTYNQTSYEETPYEQTSYEQTSYEETTPAYTEPSFEEKVQEEPVSFRSKFESSNNVSSSNNVTSSIFDSSSVHTYDKTTSFKSKFDTSDDANAPAGSTFASSEKVSGGLSFASSNDVSSKTEEKAESSGPKIIKSDLTYGIGYSSSSSSSGGSRRPKYDRPVTAPDAYDGFNYGGNSNFESDPLSDSGSSSGSLLFNREGLYGKTLSVNVNETPSYMSSTSTMFVSKHTEDHPDLSRPFGSLYNNRLDNTTSSGLTFTSATTGGVPFADNDDPFRTKVPTYSPVKSAKKPKRYEDDFTKWEREHYS